MKEELIIFYGIVKLVREARHGDQN